MSGETPLSLLGRAARLNNWRPEETASPAFWKQLVATRALTADDADYLHAITGAAPDKLHMGTLSAFPSRVVGDARPAYTTKDPLGWALAQFSTRCQQCHISGAPWLVAHQTALALVCPEHNVHLASACSVCVPRRRMFTSGDFACVHHPTPRVASDPDLVLHRLLDTRLHQAATCHRTRRWLRALRAASTLLWVDLGLNNRSISSDEFLVTHARRAIAGPSLHAQRLVSARIDRPVAAPVVNSRLLRRTMLHLHSDLRDAPEVDGGWLAQVLRDLELHPALMRRLQPHVQVLGLSSRARRTRVMRVIAREWVDAGRIEAATWRSASRGPQHIPAQLNGFGSSPFQGWVDGLSHAVVLRACLTGEAPTLAVTALGHHFTHVGPVLDVLSSRPSEDRISTFVAAVAEHLSQPAQDFVCLREESKGPLVISASTQRRFGLRFPATSTLSSVDVAAIWAWTIHTQGHPVAAPFVDGRAVRPMLPHLENWLLRQQPESLISLLEHATGMNGANTRREGRSGNDRFDLAVPAASDSTSHVTRTLRGA